MYFLAGIAFLAISAVLNIYEEPSEMQDSIIPKTTTIAEVKENIKMTGTPADNYSPDERKQHCGKPDDKSNRYIQEFEIPTPCTQPLSIITDSDGKVWFAQTNTGNLAMFDPLSEEFIEYPNDKWALGKISMMWGMSYTQDNEIWFTDEANDFLWKFSIPEKTYSKFDFPTNAGKSFPQKITFHDDHFLINDFTRRGMSSFRSLNGGIWMEMTFRR